VKTAVLVGVPVVRDIVIARITGMYMRQRFKLLVGDAQDGAFNGGNLQDAAQFKHVAQFF